MKFEPATMSRSMGMGCKSQGPGCLGKMDIEEFQVLDDVRVDLVPAS